MMDFSTLLPSYLFVTLIVATLPTLIVSASAFTKISVVLLILRNALGIQQTPSNTVLYTASMILASYVMLPVIQETYAIISNNIFQLNSFQSMERAFSLVSEPLRNFLIRYADETSKIFFIEALQKIWPQVRPAPGANDFTVLLPSFLASELTRAFQIGFLLYLPFVMIDIVVSTIVIALGLNQLSPTVLSTPLKLLLFVALDGWTRLFHGLILSYVQ
jgi:type III secretion protein R